MAHKCSQCVCVCGVGVGVGGRVCVCVCVLFVVCGGWFWVRHAHMYVCAKMKNAIFPLFVCAFVYQIKGRNDKITTAVTF